MCVVAFFEDYQACNCTILIPFESQNDSVKPSLDLMIKLVRKVGLVQFTGYSSGRWLDMNLDVSVQKWAFQNQNSTVQVEVLET